MAVQERFVDAPAQAVEAAAGLVSAGAADRGYPAGDEDRLLTDLSVHHANRLEGYRRARRATERASTAGTEELRQALLGYRALLRDLIGPDRATTTTDGATAPVGGETGADSGRDDRAAASATGKE